VLTSLVPILVGLLSQTQLKHADRVAVTNFATDDLGVRLNGPPHHKKRRVHVRAFQDVEDPIGVRRIGTVVVGERNHSLIRRPAGYRMPEDLICRLLE